MGELDQIPTTYEQAVRTLAKWHKAGGDRPITIYQINDPEATEVRLVEVSDDFPSLSGDQADAFRLGRSEEFPFPSGVVLLNPTDWERVRNSRARLPAGWDPAQAEEVEF